MEDETVEDTCTCVTGKESVNHRHSFPSAAMHRDDALETKLRHEAGLGVDSESSGMHQTMRAITMHSSRPSVPGHPPTPLDNTRQMYRLICQYCPTFVFPSSVYPTDAYAWTGLGHGSMMTFVSWPSRHYNSSGWSESSGEWIPISIDISVPYMGYRKLNNLVREIMILQQMISIKIWYARV